MDSAPRRRWIKWIEVSRGARDPRLRLERHAHPEVRPGFAFLGPGHIQVHDERAGAEVDAAAEAALERLVAQTSAGRPDGAGVHERLHTETAHAEGRVERLPDLDGARGEIVAGAVAGRVSAQRLAA